MIHPDHPLPLVRQCELLELARSTVYYRALPTTETDRTLMRRIDELHLKWPFLLGWTAPDGIDVPNWAISQSS